MTEAKYLSQSECGDWHACPFKAHVRYVAGYRPGADETMPQRVGSMGHAALAERARARFTGRTCDVEAAVDAEMTRRGWPGVSGDEYDAALAAAESVAEHIDLDRLALVPDLWGGSMGPLADVVVRVPWHRLHEAFARLGIEDDYMRSVWQCSTVRQRYAGIEGHPDLVAMPEGPGGPVVIIDYKFRQHLDLGGADGEVVSEVPDRQFCWYATLLRAAGLQPAGGIELWQVNAYAGRWLTVDDLVRVAQGGARSEAEHALITERGLLTRDAKRFDKAGAAVTAEVWAEAHRVIANMRHARAMDEWRYAAATGSKRKAPDPLTPAEAEGAARFIADLMAQRPVVVRKMRASPIVCAEVVRDMIVGVEGPLRLAAAGLTPPRHLQSWPRSACMRPGGCSAQPICLPTLGTFRGAEEAARAAEALRLPVMSEETGEEFYT